MNNFESTLALYDYTVPSHLIANTPAHPRDSAKLLVFDRTTKNVSFDTFANITTYLPKNAVLVFNETKVIPARMRLAKQTGGKIEALFLSVGATGAVALTGNVSLQNNIGLRAGNGLRAGTTQRVAPTVRVMASGIIKSGDNLRWHDGHSFMVERRIGKEAILRPSFPIEQLYPLLQKFGETPLPPYIKHSPLDEQERRTEYQTVYAKTDGSVAAPTAGLHFTSHLLDAIKTHGCDIRYVTLHVNQGTFAPVTEEHLQQKKLHEEWYEIDVQTAQFLNDAKAQGRPIIAVGTTTVRTLESAVVQTPQPVVSLSNHGASLQRLNGMTNIFLTEDDRLQFVDGLVTNFHVPRSSLLMLVSAMTGRETLLDLYKKAIEKEFRFFSFGDGMLIV